MAAARDLSLDKAARAHIILAGALSALLLLECHGAEEQRRPWEQQCMTVEACGSVAPATSIYFNILLDM